MPQLSVDCIDIVSGARAHTNEAIELLALNIKQVGLLSPVAVYENPLVQARYNMIAGRSRLAAVKKLGWPVIDAVVLTMDAIGRELAELGENLCRTDYSPIERVNATRRYAELWAAAVPGLKAHIESHERQNANLRNQEAKDDELAREIAEAPSPVEAVAKRTGKSKRKVERDIHRASAFTDAEQAILRDRDISIRRIDQLAKLKGPERTQVLNLLAAGMTFSGAMQDVLGERHTDDGEDDEPISDEQFLVDCPARSQSNKIRFDADALLYKRIQKARIAFAKQIGWGGTKAKIREMGPYGRRLMLFLDTKHPRDWIHCSQCVRGQIKGGPCNACKGGGYQLG